ncbi:hypothetical protein Lal_00025662 [Lupinus albus]|nr:hypothetical protein Lal_00025662 [Lupinus albus]
MTEIDVVQMNTMREVGIGTGKIFGSLAGQCGGYRYIGFSKKDIIIGNGDAESALQYLMDQSKSDCAMYWRHTLDEEGKLQQLFWADGCSIFDYLIFGDVLAFDATYGRNKYKFPVVIFSGVNHHKQTNVFGVAVVSNETEETYVWLLEKFLEAMNGKQPKCVINDGDLSMKNAIKRTKKAKDVQGVNFQQCELSKESVNNNRHGALSDGCRVLCNIAFKTEEDFTEMLEKVYNECSRLRSKQHSSAMENVDNATGDQVRDRVRVRAKGRLSGITSRPKRGNQCGICREIGHNRASCPNVVGSCSHTFDNDFDEE